MQKQTWSDGSVLYALFRYSIYSRGDIMRPVIAEAHPAVVRCVLGSVRCVSIQLIITTSRWIGRGDDNIQT